VILISEPAALLSRRISGVTREKRQHWQHRPAAAQFLRCKVVMLVALLSPAAAQDIRGLEVCTAEKQSCARNNSTDTFTSSSQYPMPGEIYERRHSSDSLATSACSIVRAAAWRAFVAVSRLVTERRR